MKHAVYVLDFDHGVKVGITCSIESRCADLQRGFGMPIAPLRIWWLKTRHDAWEVEQHAHLLLSDTRTYGEWFHCHPLEAIDAVEHAMRAPRIEYLRLRDAAVA